MRWGGHTAGIDAVVDANRHSLNYQVAMRSMTELRRTFVLKEYHHCAILPSFTENLSSSATFQSWNRRALSGSNTALCSSDCFKASNSNCGISISPSDMLCLSSRASWLCAGAGIHRILVTRKGVSCGAADEAMLRSGVNSQTSNGDVDARPEVTTNFRRPWLSIEVRRWQDSHLEVAKLCLWSSFDEIESASLKSL
jgi:hypothetical protein